MTFRVEVDQDKCIGCLACTRWHNFVCGNDFKAKAVRSEVHVIDGNDEAAALCPVNAISVLDPDANR
jgi:ferredoxin